MRRDLSRVRVRGRTADDRRRLAPAIRRDGRRHLRARAMHHVRPRLRCPVRDGHDLLQLLESRERVRGLHDGVHARAAGARTRRYHFVRTERPATRPACTARRPASRATQNEELERDERSQPYCGGPDGGSRFGVRIQSIRRQRRRGQRGWRSRRKQQWRRGWIGRGRGRERRAWRRRRHRRKRRQRRSECRQRWSERAAAAGAAAQRRRRRASAGSGGSERGQRRAAAARRRAAVERPPGAEAPRPEAAAGVAGMAARPAAARSADQARPAAGARAVAAARAEWPAQAGRAARLRARSTEASAPPATGAAAAAPARRETAAVTRNATRTSIARRPIRCVAACSPNPAPRICVNNCFCNCG